MEPDFTQLYSQLNLRPDCSLDEFKRAYRRRIAELHPDRGGTAAPSLETQRMLRELISLYAAAIRFSRRHGRLPGGAAHAAIPSRPPAVPRQSPLANPPPRSTRHGSAIAVLLLALLLTLLLSWYWSTPATQDESEPVAGASAGSTATAAAISGRLELGMDKDTVLTIQGEPLHRYDSEWDYGPSWLRFEAGRLIDWYSSPLYRLKTSTPSPLSKFEGGSPQKPPGGIESSVK